jgi:Na+-driven multidrug efflux pump
MAQTALQELRVWLELSLPLAALGIVELLPGMCSLVMVGHISATHLAALSLTEGSQQFFMVSSTWGVQGITWPRFLPLPSA